MRKRMPCAIPCGCCCCVVTTATVAIVVGRITAENARSTHIVFSVIPFALCAHRMRASSSELTEYKLAEHISIFMSVGRSAAQSAERPQRRATMDGKHDSVADIEQRDASPRRHDLAATSSRHAPTTEKNITRTIYISRHEHDSKTNGHLFGVTD